MLHPKLKTKQCFWVALIAVSIPSLIAISSIPVLNLSNKEYKNVVRSKSVSNSQRGRRVAKKSKTPTQNQPLSISSSSVGAAQLLKTPTQNQPVTTPSSVNAAQNSKTPTQNQLVTIPSSSAITITFPAALIFDVGNKKSQPSGALLAHPILDSHGNVIAATNSPVSLHIQPVNKGAQISADSIVIGGQVIPIHASSLWIPGKKVTLSSGTEQAQQTASLYKDVGGTAVGLFNSGKDSGDNLNVGHLIGAGIGIVSGLTSSKSVRQVEIAQGAVYVMKLEAPITVPESLARANQNSVAQAASVPNARPTTINATTKE